MIRICLHGNQWYSEREGGLCHLPVHALDHVQCKDRDKLTMVGDMWNGRPVRNMLQVILTHVSNMLKVTLTLVRNMLEVILTLASNMLQVTLTLVRNMLEVILTLVRNMLQVILILVRNMLQVTLTLNCYEYSRYMEVTVPVVMCVC